MSSHPPQVTFLSFPCDVNSLKAMPKKMAQGAFLSPRTKHSRKGGGVTPGLAILLMEAWLTSKDNISFCTSDPKCLKEALSTI